LRATTQALEPVGIVFAISPRSATSRGLAQLIRKSRLQHRQAPKMLPDGLCATGTFSAEMHHEIFLSTGNFMIYYFCRKDKWMAADQHPIDAARPEAGLLVTKAVVRAADQLRITARILATIIGVSEATVSRMKRGEFGLEPGSKPFELAVLFVRLFRSLDAIVGGDDQVAAEWIFNLNTVLDAPPIEKLQTVSGLVDVIAYLDARRALV
jgi:hypothetical protein